MKRLLVFVLLTALLLSFCPTYAYSAKALVVYEPQNGCFLEALRGDEKLPMASTTKIMTALLVLENADLSRELKIPSVAVGVEGSSMYLAKDESLTVKELLYGLMLTSGNDAATALAYHVGGGDISRFVDMMNAKSKSLGLVSTHFTNPSGLPDDDHYTTAKELAKLTSFALENPVFAEICSAKTVKIRKNGIPNGRTLSNHNKFLSMYDGAIGVKTGFTKKAGRCLVSAAIRDGVTLICVTLCAPDDWNDHKTALDNAFERTELYRLAKKGEISVSLPTPDGKTVTAKNADEITCVVIDGKLPRKTTLADNFVYAPSSAGDIVGEVVFDTEYGTVANAYLYLTDRVEAPLKKELFLSGIIRFIRNIFKWKN
ncbi:MAG: D-alanyl-D-alanine carboxypeptidase [Clostridia bacterium]|nr:D-alanyl-D-alanine carboxypeptidase [Clostridia bacterium]